MWVKGTSTRQYPASRYPANYIDGGAAQDGTLWFPDSKVFGVNFAYLGTHFAGRIINSYAHSAECLCELISGHGIQNITKRRTAF